LPSQQCPPYIATVSTKTGESALRRHSQPARGNKGRRAKAPLPAGRGNSAVSTAGRSPANSARDGNLGLLEALITSKLFQDYERAFTEVTGLPIALRPVESWQLPLHGRQNEGPFCALMAERSRTCGSCLTVQEKLTSAATREPATAVCPAGLSETIVPVRLGERLIGFLQTGQVFRNEPTQSQFERTARLLAKWGVEVDRVALRQTYFSTRVVPARQHEAVIKLLSIFAQHISMLSNQLLVHHQNAESPVITRAKAYIQKHQTDDLHLGQVAKAVNTSLFYFCKIFKKATGLNFTDYLSRIRIEKSKNLLLNPNLHVSEIAFEVGFQSLTHFNRVFKKALGQSPTHYREQLLGH
jgi:AraC-like DNA-binding protein/ligand-binding sensor protein